MSRRSTIALAAYGMLLATGGCARHEPPAKLCASPVFEDKVYNLVFDAVRRAAPGGAVATEIDRMRQEHMIAFDSVTGANAGEAGALDCQGQLRLHLDVDDQTVVDQATLNTRPDAAGDDQGKTLAASLASGAPSALISYARRPGASGAFTYTVGDVSDFASRVVRVAADLSADHARKPPDQALTGPAALDASSTPSLGGADTDAASANQTDDTTPLPAFPR